MEKRIFQSTWVFLFLCCLAPAQNTTSSLWKRYFAASQNARDAEPWKISKNLIAIVPSEKDLVWKKDSEGRLMVKTVSWVEYASSSSPQAYFVGSMTAPPTYDDNTLIWVTAVPQIKTFCAKYEQKQHDTPITVRIQQVLGMPPVKVAKSQFVEFWVHPQDMIRPTPDPEVTDHEAELEFPVSGRLVKIDDTYKAWFIEHKKNIYTRPTPGTWTRLGYTYDWGNPNHPVGESEFIIRPGARIEVDSIQSAQSYCQ